MNNLNSGYTGFSISKRAVEAYDRGEKPYSKWLKAEMLEAVEELNPSIIDKCRRLYVDELRDILLVPQGWHHTSMFFKKTKFYAIREDLEDLKPEVIPEHETKKKEPVRGFWGDITYLEWSGPRKHRRATEKKVEDVYIEMHGSFYVVFDKKGGTEILRKKKIRMERPLFAIKKWRSGWMFSVYSWDAAFENASV